MGRTGTTGAGVTLNERAPRTVVWTTEKTLMTPGRRGEIISWKGGTRGR